jgi:hypothetical protein
MISEKMFLWFEKILIKEIIIHCTDVVKRFEEIKENQVYIRYTFWIRDNSTINFFDIFINLLKNNPVQ